MSRERSHWGWGWADKFPPREARKGMAKHVGTLLGFEGQAPEDPVAIGAIELPPCRVAAPDSLSDLVSDTPIERITHSYGRAYPDLVRGFYGQFGGAPDRVARPTTEAHVTQILDWAGGANITVVPFGGGTSVVGGIEGPRDRSEGLVSLDMRGLDRVLEVDELSRSARIQAGATGPVLEAQLAERGYTLRHFPQSFEFSTLGGWIATRAGGHFATVYTHIDELVSSTRMVTPSGVMETRRLPGSGAGPSPDRLVCGSEGTLGVITEAWLRLHERPRHRSKANVLFADYSKAVEATRTIAQASLFPTNCRLLDKREAMLNMLPTGGKHLLLLGFESADSARHAWMERALEIATSFGGECPKGPQHTERGARAADGASESWRNAFFEGPYLQTTLVSLGILADTFETACTWDAFGALHDALIRTVRAAMKKECGAGFISCRFTHVYPDGPAPYYTFVAPAKRGAELEQWRVIKQVASDTLMEHGASITHHHAVGRNHRQWYDRQRPDLFASVLRAAKGVLDPSGILNPGVLID
ncbi:MAG: alkyldihydroxyacetonephosphate synthase [Myxococcota bacterium]